MKDFLGRSASVSNRALAWAAALSLVSAVGCADAAGPEGRLPVVEGIYEVQTSIVSNSCRTLGATDGFRVYVFFQGPGNRIEFRPPAFGGREVVLRDLGIQGELRRDGSFEMNGTYTLRVSETDPGVIVAFSMEGRFTGDHVEGLEHQLASFPGGSCMVTFSFTGQEI